MLILSGYYALFGRCGYASEELVILMFFYIFKVIPNCIFEVSSKSVFKHTTQ